MPPCVRTISWTPSSWQVSVPSQRYPPHVPPSPPATRYVQTTGPFWPPEAMEFAPFSLWVFWSLHVRGWWLQFRALVSPEELSLVAQTVKSLPAVRETQVRSLAQEDPLEKEMATHSRIRAWKIPQPEESGGLQSMGSKRVGHDWATSLHKPRRLRSIQWLTK